MSDYNLYTLLGVNMSFGEGLDSDDDIFVEKKMIGLVCEEENEIEDLEIISDHMSEIKAANYDLKDPQYYMMQGNKIIDNNQINLVNLNDTPVAVFSSLKEEPLYTMHKENGQMKYELPPPPVDSDTFNLMSKDGAKKFEVTSCDLAGALDLIEKRPDIVFSASAIEQVTQLCIERGNLESEGYKNFIAHIKDSQSPEKHRTYGV